MANFPFLCYHNVQEFFMGKNAIQIHPDDSVAVALEPLPKGTAVTLAPTEKRGELTVTLQEDITAGHKLDRKSVV